MRKTTLLFLCCAAALTGCVKRSILVETEPPGAQLWINGRTMGRTPVTHEFVTHGTYKFRLEKTGFQPLTARELVKAPVYEWIPVDIFFEYVFPFHLEDKHKFHYKLESQSVENRLEMETPAVREEALAGLKSPDPLKRRESCVALAARRNAEDAGLLKEAFKDTDFRVRAAAVSGLRSVEGPASRNFLLEVMRTDPAREVRWQAAAELEVLKDSQSVQGLIGALKDPDPLVRIGSAQALRTVPDPSAVMPLVAVLRDKNPGARRAAAEALGRIADPRAVPALSKVLFHHDVQTRRQAVQALALIKDPSCGLALVRTFTDWDPVIRRKATDALIQFGDGRVVPTLIRRLRGFRAWTREHAAQALGGLKDPRAIVPLKRAFLQETDLPASAAMLDAFVKLEAPLDPSWRQILERRIEKSEAKKQADLLKQKEIVSSESSY